MIIKVRNLLDQSSQYSYLAVDTDNGTGTIGVKNINAFSPSWAIQIGKTGEELSEISVLGTAIPSGTSLVLTGTTVFAHNSDTPIFAIKYDKIIFKRSISGTAGTATPMTNGTVTITPDSDYTQFDDTTSADGYAYKASFYNSVTAEETADSDWLTTSGYSFYSRAAMRERSKNKLFSAGYIKDDSVIDDWMNEWLEEMDRAAVKVNQTYNTGTAAVSFGTSGMGTITDNNFLGLKRMWVSYDGIQSYKAGKKDLAEIFPNEVFSNTHPYYVWHGDVSFEILPPENGGTANLVIYKRTNPLDSDADELPAVMRAYTKSFVNYCLAEAYYLDGQDARGDRYLARASAEKDQFITDITPRDYTGVQTMQFEYVVNADEEYFV